MSDRHNLPRLERSKYQNFAVVFWTHTLEPRATGWLDDPFHREFRETLVHAGAKYHLFCPVYCLMPDHFHVVWMGLRLASDQLNATRFLRKQVNRMLAGEELVNRTNLPKHFRSPACGDGAISSVTGKLAGDGKMASASQPWLRPPAPRPIAVQHQPHDHVLREEERKRGVFARTCFYTLNNPVRAKLVDGAWEWPFSGAVLPGYPSVWPFDEDYWPLFWRLYEKEREAAPTEPSQGENS